MAQMAMPNAPAAGIGARLDEARFEASPVARRRLDFMLQRGAVLLETERGSVRIAHSGLTARIDASGQVRWGS